MDDERSTRKHRPKSARKVVAARPQVVSPCTFPRDLAAAVAIRHPFRILSGDRIMWSGSPRNPRRMWVVRDGQTAQVYPVFRRRFSAGRFKGIICLPSGRNELTIARRLLRDHPKGHVPAGTFLVAKNRERVIACAVVGLLTYTVPQFRRTFIGQNYCGSLGSRSKVPRFAWARRFVVAKPWRRIGVGSALARILAHFVGHYWLPKCIAVEVYTSEEQRFLQRAGYKLVGISPESGRWYYARRAALLKGQEPCPCGSKLRYKWCHGRNYYGSGSHRRKSN